MCSSDLQWPSLNPDANLSRRNLSAGKSQECGSKKSSLTRAGNHECERFDYDPVQCVPSVFGDELFEIDVSKVEIMDKMCLAMGRFMITSVVKEEEPPD